MTTMISCSDSRDVVQYVEDMLQSSGKDLRWTMIISPGTSADCYAIIATGESLEDIAVSSAQTFFSPDINISQANTQAG